MGKFKLAVKLISALMDAKSRGIIFGVVLAVALAPLLLLLTVCLLISLPVSEFNEYMSQFFNHEEMELIYQIRPDLQTEQQPQQVEGYEYGMPILRTVKHYFGELIGSDILDYVTYEANGDTLFAIADGKVTYCETNENVGGYVIVIESDAPEDDDYNWSVYAKYWPVNTEEEHVELGDKVAKGDIIGYCNNASNDQSLITFCFGMFGDDGEHHMFDPIQYIGEKDFDEQGTLIIDENYMS